MAPQDDQNLNTNDPNTAQTPAEPMQPVMPGMDANPPSDPVDAPAQTSEVEVAPAADLVAPTEPTVVPSVPEAEPTVPPATPDPTLPTEAVEPTVSDAPASEAHVESETPETPEVDLPKAGEPGGPVVG